MSVSSALAFRYIFGVNANVTDNGSFPDEENMAYVAGHSIVLYNKTDRRQRFLQGSEITESITTYTAGTGKRLIAIGERGDRPVAHVFDLKTFRRKKTLNINSKEITQSKEYISMQLSSDDQMLLCLTGAPDYTLLCWNWVKAKLVASTKMASSSPMCSCSFSPIDITVASVIGKDYVRFYRVAEKDMRPLQECQMLDVEFSAHCWMRGIDDHLLVGTKGGHVHLFRSGEHICMLPCSPGPSFPIISMLAVPTGFVAGSVSGTLLYFHFDYSRGDTVYFDDQFSLVKTVQTDLCYGPVKSLFLDTAEENIGFITGDGQILIAPAISTNKITPDNIKFAVTEFHGPKPITGMDVCIKKPVFLTCGKDNSLKLWNFQTHEIEFQRSFPEDMFSVALHPSGLHCAVGFTDKLRIYHILVDDIRLCLEIPIKNCRECRFSKGGNFLAAANGNSIAVFDFYTGDKLADLRGHNGKVRSLTWLESGHHLLSCGQDGAVYIWDMDGAKRVSEYVQKGAMYTSAVATSDSVYIVGSDRLLRQLTLPDLTANKNVEAGVVLTNVALAPSKSIILGGTGDFGRPGSVRCYTYPLTTDFEEYATTGSQITRLKTTPDESFVVVTDESGLVVIYEIKDKQDRFARNNPTMTPELLTLDHWSDEILITRGELEDKANTLVELKTKVDELKLHNEYQLKLKEMNYAEKIKEVTDKFVQELEQAKTKFELLKEEKSDSEMEFLERIKHTEERHQSDVQEKETSFQAQIMELVESYQQLTRDRDAQIHRLEEQRKQLVVSHERFVQELSQDFDRKLDEERQARIQLEDEKTEVHRELEEIQTQLEDDLDTEIENVKKAFEEKLTVSRETTLKYKGENGIMKKKYIVMQREMEEQKEEMKMLVEREKELHEQIKMLEKEVSVHKKEIKTRDVTIGDREKRIYELKKKNQELDKFKFVLDYKIRELKMQIEPKQNEIMAMRDQIKTMDEELEKFHKTNASLDELIGVLRERINQLQIDTKEKRSKAKQLENHIAHFRSDVQSSIHDILTPAALKRQAERLIQVHGSSSDSIKPRLDPDVEGEYQRHKDFLQRSVLQLKKSLQESVDKHMEVNNALMGKNMDLIQQINEQRESNRALKMKVQADIGRIRHFAQQSMSRSPTKKKYSGDFQEDEEQDFASIQLQLTTAGAIGALEDEDLDPMLILEKNRLKIHAMRNAIADLEKRHVMSNAYSRELLPSLANDNNAANAMNNGIVGNIANATLIDASATMAEKQEEFEEFKEEKLTLPPLANTV